MHIAVILVVMLNKIGNFIAEKIDVPHIAL